jgi:hypothetical protein
VRYAHTDCNADAITEPESYRVANTFANGEPDSDTHAVAIAVAHTHAHAH